MREHADLVHASAVRLRAVLPAQRRAKEVKSSDIYWGSILGCCCSSIMVAIGIAVPQSVTIFLDKPSTVDPIQGQDRDPGTADRRRAPPVFGAPPK